MSPVFSSLYSFFQWLSPEYQTAYRDGFEAGKRAALRELKEASSRIKAKEPFSTATGTTSLPTNEPS